MSRRRSRAVGAALGRAWTRAAQKLRADQTVVTYSDCVERLIAYGQRIGLSREDALEVVTSWHRGTALSVVDDEALFRVPLRLRVVGNEWRPDRLIGPEELARAVLPLVDRMDQDQEDR
jgi:hypothetical protein